MVCLNLSVSRNRLLNRRETDRGRATELGPTPGWSLGHSSHSAPLVLSFIKIRMTVLTYYSSALRHPSLLTNVGRSHAGQPLTLGGHGPAVDAAPLARRVAEGWGPAPEAVAVLVVVADLEQGQGREEVSAP